MTQTINRRVKETFSLMQNLIMIAQLGFNMILPPVLCIWGASFIQKQFGAGVWTTALGAVLGITLSFMQFASFIKNAVKQSDDSKKGGDLHE